MTRSAPDWPASIRRAVCDGAVELGQQLAGVAQERRPAGVSSTRRRVRASSRQPSSSSSWRICWLSGGWEMCRRGGRAPEVQLLGDGDEVAQLAQLHALAP